MIRWFRRRKPKRLTMAEWELARIGTMFEALPKPNVQILCTVQHHHPSSGLKSAGVHYHPHIMPAGTKPQAPKK